MKISNTMAHLTFAFAIFPIMPLPHPLAFYRGASDVVARWTGLRMRMLKYEDCIVGLIAFLLYSIYPITLPRTRRTVVDWWWCGY